MRLLPAWVAATGLVIASVSGAASAPPGATGQRPPNVLLIISDDLNTGLGSYGQPVRTPNIDRLARQGVRFDRAYSQYPVCGASRASFLTGLRPNSLGPDAALGNESRSFRCTQPELVTLPQYFKNAGYQSIRIGKAFHQGVPNDVGTAGPDDALSWTDTVNPRGKDRDVETQVINFTPTIGLGRAMAWLADDAGDLEETDGIGASAAIEKLRANKDRPFFLTVGFYRPHVPEIVPRRYFDLYPLSKIRTADETPETLARVLPAASSTDVMNLAMTPDQQRQMIRAYQAATSYMDSQVGRVLAELDRLGLSRNTIVVFTSDHGFLLGEHGQWAKLLLWEQATRVPMIVRAPGIRGGTVVSKPVELLDLYPTLLDLAGLPRNARNEGASLTTLLRNPRDAAWNKPALSQITGGRSVRTDRWRYTEWEAGKLGRELYDYVSDPLEHHNLADDPAHAARVSELRALLPAGPVEERKPQPYQIYRLKDPAVAAEPLQRRTQAPQGCN